MEVLSAEEIEEMIQEVDLDHDGRVHYEEFAALFLAHTRTDDANGILSLEGELCQGEDLSLDERAARFAPDVATQRDVLSPKSSMWDAPRTLTPTLTLTLTLTLNLTLNLTLTLIGQGSRS